MNINTEHICIVFVCNKAYFNKFIKTCNSLITTGNYKGNICLVIGNDLNNDILLENDFIKKNNIIIKYFPDIEFTDYFYKINNTTKTDGRNVTKKFQWHKMHIFNTFFKKWQFIFYIDCGINIHSDILPMLQLVQKNKLLAHSDAYPTYEWKLHTQFDKTNTEIFIKLMKNYKLDIDYFQSTILIYDTNIINNNTFTDLYNLSLEYPISNTNEQGIMNLYFNCTHDLWEQIPLRNSKTNFYDYFARNKNDTNYIMTKIKNW